MAKISKKPAPGISDEERKINLMKVGQGLRKHKQSGGFYTVKKDKQRKP